MARPLHPMVKIAKGPQKGKEETIFKQSSQGLKGERLLPQTSGRIRAESATGIPYATGGRQNAGRYGWFIRYDKAAERAASVRSSK